MFNAGGVARRSLADMGVGALVPSQVYELITRSDVDLLPNGPCRSLWVGTAGTATLVRPDGNEVSAFPLKQGYNPIAVAGVRTAGTASDIWALY